jgi:hypothetical protein
MEEDKRNIIIIGYLKSGTTWLNRLLAEILDAPAWNFLRFIDENGKYQAHPGTEGEGFDRISKYNVYKTHWSPYRLELKMVKKEDLIYIVRDPRDIVCSAIGFYADPDSVADQVSAIRAKAARVMTEMEIAKDFYKFYKDGSYELGVSWTEHVSGYINHDYFWLKYEDLVDDTYGQIMRILDHLDIEIKNKRIKKAIDNQSFKKKKGYFKSIQSAHNYRFLRHGKAGQYREVFLEKDKKTALELFEPILSQLGYIDED